MRFEDVEKLCAQKILVSRIAQMFNKNSDTTRSKGVVDSLESPTLNVASTGCIFDFLLNSGIARSLGIGY
ncbi:hypothetical protein LWI29_010090 [Acer saccharum]|uniref:Uncharacterized protein n=1 Tax=Acer saccharum TaxID=4024 RepID=A0AA39RXT0_ACESA|nr:hypothetical protein LWI29_010090 [Acer saccharum]